MRRAPEGEAGRERERGKLADKEEAADGREEGRGKRRLRVEGFLGNVLT